MPHWIRIISAIAVVLFGFWGDDALGAEAQTSYRPVVCEGSYPHHLQGVCVDGAGNIFWSFTTRLVKTDAQGKTLKQIEVANHHGDLTWHDGKVYVAVNLGKFNQPKGSANSWVYEYEADDLTLTKKYEVQDVVHGAGGIAWRDGRFLVVGGLPEGAASNVVYEYDGDFRLIKEHVLAGGYTLMGIQTVAFADGHWWFGCYGKPAILLKADPDFSNVQRFEFNGSLGIVPLGGGKFLIGKDRVEDKLHIGSLVAAEADEKTGLRLTP
jgi:hypothetical protein